MSFRQFCIQASASLIFAPALTLCAAGPLPDLQQVSKPNPEPTAPVEWDVFRPPVSADAPATDVPAIAEWTRIGGVDNTVIVTGAKFSLFTGSDEGKDTEFLFYGQTSQPNGVQGAGTIQRLDGLKAAVTLPAALPSWSMYFLWPRNSAGNGYPVAINRTEAWWLNPNDNVSGGDTVSVYGRNLAHNGGTTSSWVYIKAAGSTAVGQWAMVSSVNPYRVQFKLPDAIANGNYEIWIHNGHGGSYGWSGPLSLAVSSRYQWNGTSFNVKDYGAAGDGVTDDTDAITNAHSAALAYRDQSGSPPTLHPTLYFPAGVYMMRTGISLKHDVRYTGAGKTSTTLRCSPTFTHNSEQGLIYGERSAENNIEVSNLTLDANGHFVETSFPYDFLLCATFASNWRDILLSNVQLNVPNPGNRVNAISFGSVDRLVITGCDVIGGNINLMGSTHVTIDQCNFPFVNDVFTAIYTQTVNGVSVTNCECVDQDITSDTGQGLGRLAILGGYQGSQRNFYIADNRTIACGPRVGATDQNTGEQILSEGNLVRYEGRPVSSTPNTTTFADLAADSKIRSSQTAVIVGGTGLGQTRQITAINYANQTIAVTPDWTVAPDSTSRVQIAWTTDRCVIYHNTLSGKSDYATRLTASTGIEPYGGCNEWIGDGNNISAMHYGIYIGGLAQSASDGAVTNEPCFFHYYANNAIHKCVQGVFCFADIPTDGNGAALVSGDRIGFLGNTFRSNTCSDLVSGGISIAGASVAVALDMTLFEHNTLTNVPQGINFNAESQAAKAANITLYENSFDRGTAPVDGSTGAYFTANTVAPVLRDNTWTGFQTNYAGTLPGAIIEVAQRTLDLQATNAAAAVTTSIQNSGTGPLNWVASSDSTWLTLSAASGTIKDESSLFSLTLNCDPTLLKPGVYYGTVTISAGAQTKKISVPFLVESSLKPPRLLALHSSE